MSSSKELLKDLEYFCMVENGLEVKKDANRKQYNFKRLLNELNAKKEDEKVNKRYETNISASKALVDKFEIVHTTSLDSMISIVQNGALLSINEMEKRDVSFNFRISFRGINDEMHEYVFGTTHQGDPIYGLYEIRLKREVETIETAMFIPKSYLLYGQEDLKDYFMAIKDWRTFLTEQIAVTMEDPSSYLRITPVHQRPEFLFVEKVPVSYFKSIECINEKAYDELVKRIKSDFGENNDILNIIKLVNK